MNRFEAGFHSHLFDGQVGRCQKFSGFHDAQVEVVLAWGNPCVFFKHFAKVAVAQVQRGGQFGKVNVLVELGAHLKFGVFHGDFEGRALKLPVFHLNS